MESEVDLRDRLADAATTTSTAPAVSIVTSSPPPFRRDVRDFFKRHRPFNQLFDASSANSKVYELLTKGIVHVAVEGFKGLIVHQGHRSCCYKELQKEQVEAVRKEVESQVMMKRLEERIRALEEKSIGNAAGEDP